MSWLWQVPAVVAKELLVEWRERSRVSGLFFYSFALLLMVAFAMPNTKMLADIAGGALWLGLLLASTRSLDQSFKVELENGALEGLVLWPVDPLALYYGKAIANTLVLLLVAAAIVPLVIVLYHPEIKGDPWQLVGILVLGSAALAAPGTLVAALTVQARGSSALLPMLLFPLVVPVVLASARATMLLFDGDLMGQVDDWMMLLLAFDLVHWSLDGLLFTRIVDEG
ncbi:MAG: heme exporter protein CcmB [Alphaproteobacteria bacterium]|nr:heme exporter protein CcmB [Alphaproteobacteria bacterium]